jgi:LPS-assembly protein
MLVTLRMNARVFWFTTWLLLFHPQFCPIYGQASTQELPSAPEPAQIQGQDSPSAAAQEAIPQTVVPQAVLPQAVLIGQPPPGSVVRLEADHQSKDNHLVTLTGNVVIHSQDYVIHSQEITYDDESGLAKSAGHLELDGGPDHEHITAASGDIDLKAQTAHFFNAVGTVVPPPRVPIVNPLTPFAIPRQVLPSASPFLFTAREVVKHGPGRYTLYNGVVTSCELPHPDWAFHTRRTEMEAHTAKMYDSYFTLIDVPVFFFPYATHEVNSEGRQSGFLIPVGGESSTKGIVLGEEYYWAINRSMDLQLGLDYFSLRGYSPLGQFRYKGRDLDFAQFRFTALKDRGQPGSATATTPEVDQGGTDMVFSGRHDFSPATRVFGNLEYLSSYVYRQAFAESFNQAVASEVKSDAAVVHEDDGYAAMAGADRYQNFQNTTGQQIRILHVPSLDLAALDHSLGSSGFYWSGNVAADGLERYEPGFSTSGVIERVDVYPHLGYVWHGAGWTFRPEVAARETFYGRSQVDTHGLSPSGIPVEADASLNRKDGEASVEVLAPAIEREFDASGGWQWKHVIQPEFHYRFVGGVNNFSNVLRFDATDIVSDTNEVEYGLTQRLYVRHPKTRKCKAGETPPTGSKLCTDKQQEAIRWFVGQKYFIDPSFGGAVVPESRNVLETTLDFSGAAYLTSNRNASPVVSRLRWTSTEKIDAEWDVDYDTKRGNLLSSNTFVDFHQGEWVAGAGVSNLIEPAEISLGALPPQAENFLQVRWSLGYGGPAKRGFSAATTGGYDVDANAVQYSVVQTGYNWNCCGFSVEYRRFALGTTRNENQYLFNLTLAGVGTAGNLKRAERLF